MRADHRLRATPCLVFIAALAGCSTVEMNVPFAEPPATLTPDGLISEGGYSYPALRLAAANTHSDEILLALAFSGGGKRSAAFSYGVLQGLRDMEIVIDGQPRRLLDEVDIIASVSGGSFTAAYYGLHRDRIFTDYETAFLDRDINGEIVGLYLSPWNWEWMINPLYGTNDAMAEIYDDAMFGGATFEALIANGLPLINISATDITAGEVFPFNQTQFDMLCSDLASYPIARAVAASNGFPVLFTPITIENHAEQCNGLRPHWIDAGLADPDPLSRRGNLAQHAQEYLDPESVRYVHLMDGGIADNLAMRGMVNNVTGLVGGPGVVHALGLEHVRRIILVSADGQAAQDRSWAQQRTVSSIGQILTLMSGTQIDRYNFETLQLARDTLVEMADLIRETRCADAPVIGGHPCGDVTAQLVHVSLAGIADEEARTELQSIPTGLTIPGEAVDLLARYGRELTLAAPELRALADEFAGSEASAPIASR